MKIILTEKLLFELRQRTIKIDGTHHNPGLVCLLDRFAGSSHKQVLITWVYDTDINLTSSDISSDQMYIFDVTNIKFPVNAEPINDNIFKFKNVSASWVEHLNRGNNSSAYSSISTRNYDFYNFLNVPAEHTEIIEIMWNETNIVEQLNLIVVFK